MAVKRAVFAELDRATRAEAVLATNTSYLDVNRIAEAVRRTRAGGGAALLLAGARHEARGGDPHRRGAAGGAGDGARLRPGSRQGGGAERGLRRVHRQPDHVGLSPRGGLHARGRALPQEVDAAMVAFGFPMGVFAMQDLAGLDIAWAMRKRRAATRPAGGALRGDRRQAVRTGPARAEDRGGVVRLCGGDAGALAGDGGDHPRRSRRAAGSRGGRSRRRRSWRGSSR